MRPHDAAARSGVLVVRALARIAPAEEVKLL